MDSNILSVLYKFFFLFGELTLLFLGINFLVQVIQANLPPEKIQKILGHNRVISYVFAVILGSVTPFCTCSTIPMLKGMMRAKVAFGPMMTFLFVSPLLNPIVIFLFLSMIGWKITLIYTLIALGFSLGGSILLAHLGFDRYLMDHNSVSTDSCSCSSESSLSPSSTNTLSSIAYKNNLSPMVNPYIVPESGTSCCATGESTCTTTLSPNPWFSAGKGAWKDFVEVLPYLIISCLIGALTYEYIPSEFLQKTIGSDNPFAIPIAAVIGIPLYVRASVLIPLASVLVSKGVSIGAMIALIIGGSGASLPEVILLKSLFKKELLIAFLINVLFMAVVGGTVVQFFLS